MMKLYFSKAACSMSVHIVLEELQLPYEAIAVDLTQNPSPEFLKVNPMGQVPALLLENGQSLTEIGMILQFLADQKPELKLAPAAGTMERYRLQEWLNFIASEVHKAFGPLWAVDFITQNPEAQEDIKKFTKNDLGRKFDVISKKLGSQDYLMSTGYSVADPYLFTVLNWTHFVKMDLSPWPTLQSFMTRVRERPATIRTLKAEHLMN